MKMGERIKEARIKKGLTQEELAKLLGYKSKSSVAHMENGRDIPRTMVVKLAEVLETTPAYLMGWEPSSPDSTSTNQRKTAIEIQLTDPDTGKDIAVIIDKWSAIYELLKQFPEEKIDDLIDYAEYLAEKEKKENQ